MSAVDAERRWELDVQGMTCDACERHVGEVVRSVGAADVEVSWRRGRARFSATAVDAETLANAIGAAGYRAGGLREVAGAPVRAGDGGWDLAILGAGSAAFAAAIRASEAGARVVIIERDVPGGTCVNVGCVPSKAMLRAGEVFHGARHHAFAGVPHLGGAVDLAALVAQKDELVVALRQAKYLDLIAAYGLTLRHGEARFVDRATIAVDGEPLRAASYLIATGARPSIPPIVGLADVDYLTSTTALQLTVVPRSVAVIGANAIGLELGQLFGHLGAEVTFLEMLPRIAPFEEPEISEALASILRDEGATVITGASIERVSQRTDGLVLEGDLGNVTSLAVERVLVATGRAPNTADLHLDVAGIAVDPRGFVVVDELLRTTNLRVWAAGDVTASPQFVYVSAAEGALAADNAISGAARTIDDRTLPRVTFTAPPIAAVGLTEAQAADAGHDVVTAVLPLAHVPRAIVNRDTRGVIKLVADRASDRLLGAHVLAEGAGDVIQAAVYALMAAMTTTEMAAAFHPYLTMAEGLKLAAQTFSKDVAQLSCCAA